MKKGSSTSSLKIVEPAGEEPGCRPGVRVKREQMVNALNRINFHNGHVYVTMKHHRFNFFVNVAALPQPCCGEDLDLLWCDPEGNQPRTSSAYEYQEFFYTDGLKKVRVEAVLRETGPDGLRLLLPEAGQDVSRRRCRRYACPQAISAQISQSGLVLQGLLADFNGYGFAVEMAGASGETMRQLNADNPVNVLLQADGTVLFAEPCRIIRLTAESPRALIVLAPTANQIIRFRAKEVRSVRQHLNPQPSIELSHPFTAKKLFLRAVDISGSGLAVEEEASQSLLMPGLVIPQSALVFSNNFRIACRVQVLFNRPEEDATGLRCGLVFLDMDAVGQLQLSSMLCLAQNEHSCLGAAVDLDDLWNFFFETGFIYPRKYSSIQEHKEKFKKLYSRLYNREGLEISRHIIYQDRGVLLGHVSMFRYYYQTWLLHHHAAVKSSQHKAGLVVMYHILRHINEVHRLSSNRMRYIACYFRPDNRFAARVFGGSARAQGNPQHCSLDDFAYFHYQGGGGKLPAGWRLEQTRADDLRILEYFYREMSGGLLLEGLDLYSGVGEREEEIDREYRRFDLRRQRRFFSLRRPDDGLAALLVVNIADVGLNLSDLTNGVQVMVIDDRGFSPALLDAALQELTGYHEQAELAVLLFPLACADAKKIPYDKVYQLGILDLDYISEYLKFMEGLPGSSLRLKSILKNGREKTV